MSDCGYQDVECWVRELHAAGWTAVGFRRGGIVPIKGAGTTWQSPDGQIYRGPFMAWKIMRASTAASRPGESK